MRTARERPAPPKQIDAATIAAYEKRGGRFSEIDYIWPRLPGARRSTGNQIHLARLPGARGWNGSGSEGAATFHFQSGSFTTAKLPPVAVPFGLSFTSQGVSDEGLKDLATLKNLSSLGLAHTRVTDVGLKGLAGAKDLTALGLFGTRVTGVGLKELAGLEKLSSLDLGGTRLTARACGKSSPWRTSPPSTSATRA